MSGDNLDQLVKGAPPPNISPTQVAQSARASANTSPTAPHAPSDPRDNLPSSPAQIYLNLLILESSLRLQYLSLRARLRLHLLLLTVLSAWILLFTWLLFFRPREDGSGVGGSVYWVLETTYKLAWGGGVVTACLFYATGMYERGVRWPRKFVSTSNRGLRQFNLKIIIVRGSFLSELLGWVGAGWWGESKRVNFQVLPKDIETSAKADAWNAHAARHGLIEEDIAPAGDVLKVLLLPKPFSPDFREGWENWRGEYWERENHRRAELRRVVKLRRREVARREGGWLWWTGWRGWRNVHWGAFRGKSRRQLDLEKLALREKPITHRAIEKQRALRPEAHSRSSSRSATPVTDNEGRPTHRRTDSRASDREAKRRGSSASSAGLPSSIGSGRRPKKVGSYAGSSRLSAAEAVPEVPSPLTLSKRTSELSTGSSTGSDETNRSSESPPPLEIKKESVDS
ncbi:hypothetical protein B0A48_07624 [Cryoendolithus antarcticus]|uniref:Spo7-like protein n=1 Tax=Cryoendolithus antarcticus TaxID=1507870 RepID=A0A1V8T750_9PEZI|nr:hypothetical protein B0A48_07624 [Cryoendolithus antarcticus]